MAAELHSSGWILVAWALAGIITLFGALCSAEVAGLLADTGGEYSYYKKIYNRFFAFIFGWSLFAVIQTAAISSLAYVFAQSFNNIVHLPTMLPSLADFNIMGVFYPFADFNIKLIAIIIIILLSWINTKGIKTGAGVSTTILLLVIGAILTIIVFGLTSSHADMSRLNMQPGNNKAINVSNVFTGMLGAFWAYQGWSSIGFIGGEIKNARRNLPKGIAIGVFVIIALYLLVNTTYLSLMPVQQLEEIYTGGTQIAAVESVRSFWGDNGALFISILIVVTTLGCCNASILSGCRPTYAMANEGLFFSKAARLNNKQAPSNALSFQCVWACMLVLSGSFDQLTDMIIFAVFIYYGATALGVFILRKTMPNAERPYKVWGYPVVPAIFILFCAALVFNTIFSRPREAAIGMVLMLTGVPMYWWFKKKYTQHDISNKTTLVDNEELSPPRQERTPG